MGTFSDEESENLAQSHTASIVRAWTKLGPLTFFFFLLRLSLFLSEKWKADVSGREGIIPLASLCCSLPRQSYI